MELIQIKFRGRNSIIKIARMTRKFSFCQKNDFFKFNSELIQIKFRGRNSIIKMPEIIRKFNFWKKNQNIFFLNFTHGTYTN